MAVKEAAAVVAVKEAAAVTVVKEATVTVKEAVVVAGGCDCCLL